MQGAPLLKRLIDNEALGLAVAFILAILPLANWLGVILALVIILRHGGVISLLVYPLVSVASYLSLTGYSFSLLASEWAIILVMYLPLGMMALLLSRVRSLSLSLAGGMLVFMAVLLLGRLVLGPPNPDDWVAFFQCRLKAAGMTETDMMDYLPGHNLKEVVQVFLVGWPLSVSLIQVGLLMMARWVQSRIYYPGGFQRDFHGLKQPKPIAFACGAVLLAVTFVPTSMLTLMHLGILALVLMGITGLGFVHGYLAGKRYSFLWLGLIYLFLVLSTWSALMLLAVLALLDSGLNLSKFKSVR